MNQLKFFLFISRIKNKLFKYRYLDFNIFLTKLNEELKGQVSFLQIGASDGVTNDPIYNYVRRYNWKGILVEPLPDVFDELKRNYSENTNLTFLNVAVSVEDGKMILYYLPKNTIREAWHKQLASFNRTSLELNLKNNQELISKIESTYVPTKSLQSVMRVSGQSKIDLMVLDVEGYEFEILKQLTTLSALPEYIFYEKGTMPGNVLDLLRDFLTSLNYKMYNCGPDELAVKE